MVGFEKVGKRLVLFAVHFVHNTTLLKILPAIGKVEFTSPPRYLSTIQFYDLQQNWEIENTVRKFFFYFSENVTCLELELWKKN
jgi:hypothetical protein